MRSATLLACAAALLGWGHVPARSGPPAIGLNLTQVSYFSPEVVFVDVCRQTQPMFAHKTGAPWPQSDPGAVEFGDNGYPVSIASDHTAGALWDVPRGYPGGPHVLLWDGVGDVTVFLGSDPIVDSAPGRLVFDLASGPTRRLFRIEATDPSNPARNLRCVPLAYEAALVGEAPAEPFRREFLDQWSQLDGFRYMDWAATNDSTVARWEDRPKPTDQTQGSRGVALEYQIAHANRTATNPWFNIPHLADDDYVRRAATLIRDRLAPTLVARIEYSNEVWNGQFQQSQHAKREGASLPDSDGGFQGSLWWYSKRSVEVFDIFAEVFTEGGANPAGADRLVRVLSAQAGNPWTGRQILSYGDAYLKADALAIAPYFDAMVAAGPDAERWKDATWSERLSFVEEELQASFSRMEAYRDLLRDTVNESGETIYDHIQLFAYEGGQHFLGHPNTHEDEPLTEIFWELNRRPEMREFYRRYLERWEQIGGADFMLFASASEFGRWGSWGLVEYEGQPIDETPKLQGVMDYLDSVITRPPGDRGTKTPVAESTERVLRLADGSPYVAAPESPEAVGPAAD
ncbi:MAG: hypothetical protein AAF805_03815 [Planctomycetota bacterium]